MPSLTDLLGNPLTEIMKGASDIIARFVADPNAKIQATQELAKLQEQYQEKLIDADVAWAKTQAESIEAETKSESWMARNWRPILMLSFTYIIVHTFVFVPLFSLKAVEIPPDMWSLLKLGMGGYIIGRSAEKLVPDVTSAIMQAKK